MEIVFNSKPVKKSTLVELLESLKKNNLDSKVEKALLMGLAQSYKTYLSREREIYVWKKLQYQAINPSKKEGYEHPDQDKINQHVEWETEFAIDNFKLNCKKHIETFLYNSLLNESMYGQGWEYPDIHRPNKGELTFNFCGSFGSQQLEHFGLVSREGLELSYSGPKTYLYSKIPQRTHWSDPFGYSDTDDDDVAPKFDIYGENPDESWGFNDSTMYFDHSHNDDLRYVFANEIMPEWRGNVIDSGESKSNSEGYSVSSRFNNSLFYRLEQYTINRKKMRQQSGSEYFWFRFFGFSASVKIKAAEKLQRLCGTEGRLKLTGALCLTSTEAKALINGSLGRTCSRLLKSRPKVLNALNKVAEFNSKEEMSIDLGNGGFSLPHKQYKVALDY